MTPDRLNTATDRLMAQLRDIEDSAIREATCRVLVVLCRQIRAEALRDLHRQLGSWQKVGDAVGVPRQDAWRAAKAR